jgi:hypothetical protein
MRLGFPLVPLVILALATPGQAGEPKSRKPRLDLRASPRVAMSPVNVLLVAELVGGEAGEEFYCPGLEWEWGDGGKSSYESDCAPFGPGAELERRFSATHAYLRPGDYQITVKLRRADRSLASATASITVRGLFASSE